MATDHALLLVYNNFIPISSIITLSLPCGKQYHAGTITWGLFLSRNHAIFIVLHD